MTEDDWVKLPPHLDVFKIMLESAEIEYEETFGPYHTSVDIEGVRFVFSDDGDLSNVEVE